MIGKTFVPVCGRVVSGLLHGLVSVVRLLAFWSAIVLPFLSITLLVVGPARVDTLDIAMLVGANATAVALGHGYSGSIVEEMRRVGERAR